MNVRTTTTKISLQFTIPRFSEVNSTGSKDCVHDFQNFGKWGSITWEVSSAYERHSRFKWRCYKYSNPSKALGPDELHPRVLKELVVELGPVFAHLFQQSLDKGGIPKEWNETSVHSISRVTELYQVTVVQYPWHVFLARSLNTITVINDWANILDAGGQVSTFILDFEKAFDTPPHELLK